MTGLSKALLGATSRRDFLKATLAAASATALGNPAALTQLAGVAPNAAA